MRGVWTLTTAPDRDRTPQRRPLTVTPEVAQALTVVPPVLLQGVFVSPLPAVRGYAQKGTTGDASVAPYALMVANGTVWLTYGVLIGAPTVALPNITAVSLGMYYTNFHSYKPEDAPLPYVIAALSALAVGTPLALEPGRSHRPHRVRLPAMFGPTAAKSVSSAAIRSLSPSPRRGRLDRLRFIVIDDGILGPAARLAMCLRSSARGAVRAKQSGIYGVSSMTPQGDATLS